MLICHQLPALGVGWRSLCITLCSPWLLPTFCSLYFSLTCSLEVGGEKMDTMAEPRAFVSPLEGMALELKPQQFTACWEKEMLPREQVAKLVWFMVLL